MENEERKVWFVLDLETTGLDPKQDCILEIGAIAVDAKTLEELGRFHSLVQADPKACMPHPVVLKMHGDNGLWAELAQATTLDTRPNQVAVSFMAWSRQFQPTGRIVLAGDSVHFDLSFLWAWLDGNLAVRFGHRVINTSTFRDAFREWGLPETGDAPGESAASPAHRAMADAERSLRTLRRLREAVQTGQRAAAVGGRVAIGAGDVQ